MLRFIPAALLSLSLLACSAQPPLSPASASLAAELDALGAVRVLRTPDARFADLPGYPFRPHYRQVARGQLRMHYLDEGPRDGPTIVLLHGVPSWSYLYRKMVPPLTGAGYRVIVPDLVGFGRSDKLADPAAYTYAREVRWTGELLAQLDLGRVTLYAQDWGGLIGLRLVATDPARFARVMISNTALPDGTEPLPEGFFAWLNFVKTSPQLPIGQIIEGGTVGTLTPEIAAAYDAPFPDETYKAGARQLPQLVPLTADDPQARINQWAWSRLRQYGRPFLTAFSDSDPITKGLEGRFQRDVPGAAGQPHLTIAAAGHFLQEDKGEELAGVLIDFIRRTPER